MQDDRDVVELTGQIAGPAMSQPGAAAPPARPYLMLWFQCAGQYARAYKERGRLGYCGRCPTCGKTIRFGVGPHGTDKRTFQVTCE